MEIVIILVLVLTVLVFINMVMLTRYHNKVTKLDEVFKQKHDIIYSCCIECRAFLKKVQDLKFVTNFSDVDKTLKELKPMIKNITNVIDGLGIKDLKSDIRTVLSNQKLDNCKLNDILKTLDVELAIVKHIESAQTDDFVINKNKLNDISKTLAEISSVIDCMREKVNYIETYILNNTKLKTASKTKTAQTKTTTTPANKKGVQKYL